MVKEPDKLREAGVITYGGRNATAVQENPSTSEKDFAADQKVVPRLPLQKNQEPMVPEYFNLRSL
ncbi:hypothetical protein [Nostoc parmelioides]|uniref:Uncharacterized protein n=1 Tax=Nostoc parmelioides FACHB-3921 TaxID=2692909 RepID=A0ABR8BIF5_9NOSO|nr:hypothetical protein [Nostoc parmelioides]MBD2253319.1 hypothetical protein [Nostoc parmelioides FACHB-3921]